MHILILCAGISAGCLLAARILIHYFQLESYQHPGYFRTLRRNPLKSVLPGCCMTVLLIAAWNLAQLLFVNRWLNCGFTALAMIVGGCFCGKLLSEKKAKKKLVYTPRMKRLYAVSFVVMTDILMLIVSFVPSAGTETSAGSRIPAALFLFSPALLPVWIALCGLLAWPIEKAISELYFRDAQRILKSRNDLIRIGITGSWGKTSVKFILGTLLEEKYHTLVTPASFNTPMGVTKVIRSRLEPGHRIFVAEMGARHVGDIREMCRLVHPVIGILTSVGPQHLDTFRTVERVARTKYELIDALPADGTAFFADDGDLCRKLYDKTGKEKWLAGLDPDADDLWAEEITVSENGSTFCLCNGKAKQPCHTALLGELNIRNIVLCASVCLKLGLTMEQIARGIGKIQPIEHRLQLIPNPGGLTVIDDAFNSNIRGAEQAFSVLKQMQGTRILVTPGMVELGEREEEMNRSFGSMAAEACDLAILVGKKRSAAIAEGFRAKGFPEGKIIITHTLEEAAEKIKTIAKPGDTVLFENDLPDHYTE